MSFRKLWNRHLLLPTFCVLAFAGVFTSCVWLRAAGKMQTPELWVYDTMLRLNVQLRQYSAADDVVVIGIDETDYHLLGHYPLNDGDKLALLKKLIASEPRAIGIDIYLDIPVHDDNKSKEDNLKDTQDLRTLITRTGKIVCCYLVGRGDLVNPEVRPPTKDGTHPPGPRHLGFDDMPYDRDDTITRLGILYLSDIDQATGTTIKGQSLSVGVANQFLESAGVLQLPIVRSTPEETDAAHLTSFWHKRVRRFRAGDGGFGNVDDHGFQYLVDYRGPTNHSTYALRQVLPEIFNQKALAEIPRWEQRPNISAEAFRGKAILIGNMAASIRDFTTTPMNLRFDHYGVLQHATLVDQLIRTARGDSVPLSIWSNYAILVWAAFWGLAGVAAGLTVGLGFSVRAWRLLFLAVLGQAIIIAVTLGCFSRGIWVPMIPASFCWLGTLGTVGAYMAQMMRADRNALHSIFAGVVQKPVAEELWRRRDELFENGSLRPRKLIATVMFTDLMGFTSACENLDPKDVIAWVNQYHEVMTRVVIDYNGVVIRYMGDGMMVVFGAPCADQVEARFRINAEDAVNCALQMRRQMPALHQRWAERNWPKLMMRVGIQSGVVLEGIVGSSSRFEYVTLGDTTNLASRLESYDKKQMGDDIAADGCRILIGAPTRRLLSERIQVAKLEPFELKGKKALVEAFGVIGPVEPAPPSWLGQPAHDSNSTDRGRAARAAVNQRSQ